MTTGYYTDVNFIALASPPFLQCPPTTPSTPVRRRVPGVPVSRPFIAIPPAVPAVIIAVPRCVPPVVSQSLARAVRGPCGRRSACLHHPASEEAVATRPSTCVCAAGTARARRPAVTSVAGIGCPGSHRACRCCGGAAGIESPMASVYGRCSGAAVASATPTGNAGDRLTAHSGAASVI